MIWLHATRSGVSCALWNAACLRRSSAGNAPGTHCAATAVPEIGYKSPAIWWPSITSARHIGSFSACTSGRCSRSHSGLQDNHADSKDTEKACFGIEPLPVKRTVKKYKVFPASSQVGCWPLFMQRKTACASPSVSARPNYAALSWYCSSEYSVESSEQVLSYW